MFISPSLDVGGAEKVLTNILCEIDRRRYKILLILLTKPKSYELIDRVQGNVSIVYISKNKTRNSFCKLLFIIFNERPDIIFSNLWYCNIIVGIIAFFYPFKCNFICRESSIPSKRFNLINDKNKTLKWLYCFAHKKYQTIICQSEYMYNDLCNNFKFDQKKLKIIANPVNRNDIIKLASYYDPYKNYRKDSNFRIVTFVGRLAHAKGLDILVDAINQINQLNIKYFIVGDGPERYSLEKLVKQLNLDKKIIFVGHQKNPYIWMKHADAVISSSRYDGFPNALLEALVCGTPIISTPSPGGVKELINESRVSVLSFNQSANSLASTIKFWNKLPNKRVDYDITDKYDIQQVIKNYEIIFDY
jgi:glycosyltransferase involved in cell wall biosynthesis